jgi:hypothetical protein
LAELFAIVSCSIHYQTIVKKQAEKDLNCPSDKINLVEMHDGASYDATGCGNSATCFWNYKAASYTSKPDEELIKRASFDFKCPEPSLIFKALSKKSIGVEGCEHSGVYIYTEISNLEWNWVLNSADVPYQKQVESSPTK